MSESVRFLSRRPRRAVALVVALSVTAMMLFVTGTDGHSQTNVFHESFDGAPSSPPRLENTLPGWDVQYHARNQEAWEQPPAMNGHHGPGCEAPLAMHEITQWPDAVYRCANHFMTTANGNPGYGLIYVTPPAMLDWSGGNATLSFDVSTHRTAPGRDWWDVYITPWDVNMARPLEDWLPDLNGEPREAIHLRINAADELCLSEIANHDSNSTCGDTITSHGTANSDEESARQRETVEIRIEGSTVGVYVNGNLAVSRSMSGPVMNAGMGVVQLGHHSYTPEKDEPENDGINTYHWDEVHIEPAREFSSIDASPRHVRGDPDEVVTLNEPAPADAMLRFAATSGQPVEVSFDNGATWEVAQRVPMLHNRETHAQSYFTPIPEGTTEIRFQTYGSWAGSSFRYVQDASVWSLDTSTNEPAATATPTNTPAPTATATPSPTQSPDPTATPTQSPDPTATPTPEPTATPEPDEDPDGDQQWTMSASAASSTLEPGDRQTVRVRVESAVDDRGLVDVEIYDAEGNKIFQRYWDDRKFSADKARSFLIRGQVPADAAPGEYVVKVGVFEPQPAWGTFLAWEGNAARFEVQ